MYYFVKKCCHIPYVLLVQRYLLMVRILRAKLDSVLRTVTLLSFDVVTSPKQTQ